MQISSDAAELNGSGAPHCNSIQTGERNRLAGLQRVPALWVAVAHPPLKR